MILDINLSLLFPIIDRLLGGGSDPTPPARRPLTEIELRLVSRITDLFCKEMKHAWENVLDLDLSIDRVESNPQLVQIVPPNEVVVLISFELTLGDARGMMNLCIPFNSIERISTRLSSNSWVSYGKKPATPENIQRISSQLSDAVVEVVVDLAETNISTSDLIGLRVGDIIATEKDVERPLVVSVEGRPKFHAQPGVFKGRKAIQVIGPIDCPESSVMHADATAGLNDRRRRLRAEQSPAPLRRASARPARSAPRRPRHRVGRRREVARCGIEELGSVILASAQVLIVYMNTVGTPVTSQTSGLRRVRHSQTVTPSSVSAASKLVARAEQVPERPPDWLLLPIHDDLVQHEVQRHAGRRERAQPAAAPIVQPGQLLNDVAAQPRADIERVVDERRERHQAEGHGERVGNVQHAEKLAQSRGVDEIRAAGEQRSPRCQDHHAAQRDHGHHRFEQHRTVADRPGIGFAAQLLRRRAGGDQRVKTGARAAGDRDEQERRKTFRRSGRRRECQPLNASY